jgi:hypothetical protein
VIRGLVRLGIAIALAITAGCAGAVAPTYSQEELQQHCVRDGGWWRSDALLGGYCEFESPGGLV